MTEHSNFPLRAARNRAARGNGTAVHNAPHVAVQHTTAAASRAAVWESSSGWQRVQYRDLDSSAADTVAHARGSTSFWTNASLAAVPTAALLNTARGKEAWQELALSWSWCRPDRITGTKCVGGEYLDIIGSDNNKLMVHMYIVKNTTIFLIVRLLLIRYNYTFRPSILAILRLYMKHLTISWVGGIYIL